MIQAAPVNDKLTQNNCQKVVTTLRGLSGWSPTGMINWQLRYIENSRAGETACMTPLNLMDKENFLINIGCISPGQCPANTSGIPWQCCLIRGELCPGGGQGRAWTASDWSDWCHWFVTGQEKLSPPPLLPLLLLRHCPHSTIVTPSILQGVPQYPSIMQILQTQENFFKTPCSQQGQRSNVGNLLRGDMRLL